MATVPAFDTEPAHRHFASHYFNASWKLMGKPERTPDDDETLIALGHASLWHWTQRPDCSDKNLSVAHWLLARIYSVTARPEEAHRHAIRCLALSQRPGVAPYFLGCAHEACARVAGLRGESGAAEKHACAAREIAESLEPGERKMLLDDLATGTPT